MNLQMSKAKTILFVIAILCSAFAIMWQLSSVVIIANFYELYPDHIPVITATLAWPQLVQAIAALIAGFLLKKLSTKTELIIAGVLLLFGIAVPWIVNAYWLFTCSMLMSVGAGFSNTAGAAIIAEVFCDFKRRERMIGYYTAMFSGWGVLVTFFAGLLAVSGWQHAYYVNWFAIIMLLMTIFWLPNIKPSERVTDVPEEDATDGAPQSAGKGLTSSFWMLLVAMVLFYIVYVGLLSLISVYIAENNLGNEAFVGTCTSVAMIGSFIGSMIFGPVYHALRTKAYVVVWVVVSIIAFGWAWLVPGRAAALLCPFIASLTYGAFLALGLTYVAETMSPAKQGTGIGIVNCVYPVGMWAGNYVYAWAMGFTGGSLTATFPWMLVLLVISIIIALVGVKNTRQKETPAEKKAA